MSNPNPKPATVARIVNFLSPQLLESPEMPDWPPDVFAIVATLLHRSGAYRKVADAAFGWPPTQLTENSQQLGRGWRSFWNKTPGSKQAAIPGPVIVWWKVLSEKKDLPVNKIIEDEELSGALLALLAVTDEACYDLGLASFAIKGEADPFRVRARELLQFGPHAPDLLQSDAITELTDPELLGGASLCQSIHPSLCRILPKLRTPQRGLTLRSFSFYLSFCVSGEVEAIWRLTPINRKKAKGHLNDKSLNLLLLPWPCDIQPEQFKPAIDEHCNYGPLGDRYFTYELPERNDNTLERTFEY